MRSDRANRSEEASNLPPFSMNFLIFFMLTFFSFAHLLIGGLGQVFKEVFKDLFRTFLRPFVKACLRPFQCFLKAF